MCLLEHLLGLFDGAVSLELLFDVVGRLELDKEDDGEEIAGVQPLNRVYPHI